MAEKISAYTGRILKMLMCWDC